MEASSPAHLHGVWAKWERAVEQLRGLDDDIGDFGRQVNPYTTSSHIDADRGYYRFEFRPAWHGSRVTRWGAIIGEIVHDFRSALDNLVWQLVILNGGKPDDGHSFPIRSKEPANGFAVELRRQWTDKRGRLHHGPLFGVSDQATAIIEACQPYHGGGFILLERLHALWNIDKHRHLLPMNLVAAPPEVTPLDAEVFTRRERMERGAYVIELTVNPDTRVDVKPQPPTDVTLGDGSPVVIELREVGKLIHITVLSPCADLFSGMSGVGPP